MGALLGWLAGLSKGVGGRTVMLENVLVGIFGAFVGGDFIVAQLDGAPADGVFHLRSLAMAIGGSVFMLLALRLMRRRVGPMRASRPPARRRY